MVQVKDLKELGIDRKTIEDCYVDIGQVICDEEFSKKIRDGDLRGYRERAVDRLVELGVSFSSNSNILYNMMLRYVKVECPKCHEMMKRSSGGGNGDLLTTNYWCEHCNTKVNLTLPVDGIGVIGERG